MPAVRRATPVRKPPRPLKPRGFRFMVEPHDGKPRIFGFTRNEQWKEVLFAVATLPNATLEAALELAGEMNAYALDGSKDSLNDLLANYPPAVQAGVRQALPTRAEIGRHAIPDFGRLYAVPDVEEDYDEGEYTEITPRTAALLWVETGMIEDWLDEDLGSHAPPDNDVAVGDENDKSSFIYLDSLPQCTHDKNYYWRRRTRDMLRGMIERLATGKWEGPRSLGEAVLWREIVWYAQGSWTDMEPVAKVHEWILEIPSHPQDFNFDDGLWMYRAMEDDDVLDLYDMPRDHDLPDTEWFGGPSEVLG